MLLFIVVVLGIQGIQRSRIDNLLKGKPCALACWECIVSIVLLRVPIPLVIALSIHIVIFVQWVIHFSHSLKHIVIGPVLIIEILETFFTEEMATSLMSRLLLMALVLFDKFAIVFVVFHAVLNVFL